MVFLSEIKGYIPKEITEITEYMGIDLDLFVTNVNKFDNLDDALRNLNEKYLSFYILNYEHPVIKNLTEMYENTVSKKSSNVNEDDENDFMRGVSREIARQTSGVKIVRYKGNFYSITHNKDSDTFQPNPEFRSIVDAIKYAKYEMDKFDEYMKKKRG